MMGSSPLHLPHISAIAMNENAVILVERKRYNEAIESLSAALIRCREDDEDESSNSPDRCPCPRCSPCVYPRILGATDDSTNDSAVFHESASTSINGVGNDRNGNTTNYSIDIGSSNSSNSSSSGSGNQQDENSGTDQFVLEDGLIDVEVGCFCGCGYIHDHLISLPCPSLIGHTRMAETLPLILVFNLAIANHLRATSSSSSSSSSSIQSIKSNNEVNGPRSATSISIERAFRLYELVNSELQNFVESGRLGVSFHDPSVDVTGIHLHLILCNNLSHLHCFLGNHFQQKQCIERLTEVIMCIVDYRIRERENEFRDSEPRPGTENSIAPVRNLRDINLEGFLRTISPSVLASYCAGAA